MILRRLSPRGVSGFSFSYDRWYYYADGRHSYGNRFSRSQNVLGVM